MNGSLDDDVTIRRDVTEWWELYDRVTHTLFLALAAFLQDGENAALSWLCAVVLFSVLSQLPAGTSTGESESGRNIYVDVLKYLNVVCPRMFDTL